MQQLSTFLNIKPSQCVSIMGAGGKSTLMNRLADELIVLGRTVVLSSTTNYHRPKVLQSDQILLIRDAPDWPDQLGVLAQRWNRLLVLHHDLGDAMVKGIDVAAVHKIHDRIPDAIVILKTDGARKRWFKAPNQSEPVIPPWSQLSITVVNCEILGQPLTEGLVHRPERVAELTGLHLGDPITPQAVGDGADTSGYLRCENSLWCTTRHLHQPRALARGSSASPSHRGLPRSPRTRRCDRRGYPQRHVLRDPICYRLVEPRIQTIFCFFRCGELSYGVFLRSEDADAISTH